MIEVTIEMYVYRKMNIQIILKYLGNIEEFLPIKINENLIINVLYYIE
jgi:hypothetical protein